MSDSSRPNGPSAAVGASQPSLEEVIAERDRLRREVDEARAEARRLLCRAEILREEWFVARQQEEEYRRYIIKLTGYDPAIAPEEILDAMKNGVTMNQILDELDKAAGGAAHG